METVFYVFGGILLAALVLCTILFLVSRATGKTSATTAQTSGAQTGSTATTSSLAVLGGIRDKGWPFIVILLALWAWYMTSNNFGEKAGTTLFVVGLIVIVINVLILSIPAPFKENKLRKLSYASFWIVGIFFLARGAGLDWESFTNKLVAINTSASASTLAVAKSGGVLVYNIVPNKWTNVTLPTNKDFDCDAPGDLEYLFPDGTKIFVKDLEDKKLGRLPSRSFKIRGTAGEVTFTIH